MTCSAWVCLLLCSTHPQVTISYIKRSEAINISDISRAETWFCWWFLAAEIESSLTSLCVPGFSLGWGRTCIISGWIAVKSGHILMVPKEIK